jgi:hypothetical protein
MADNLLIFAGKKALPRLREQGLAPDDIEVIAGAAGGPKWLVLNGLDRAIFFQWFMSTPKPCFLIGSSIGGWRFAAIAQGAEAYDRFEQAYIAQSYSAHPSPADVTRESARILDVFLDSAGVETILNHPVFRINLLAVRCRGLFRREGRPALIPAMFLAAGANALSRKTLKLFFTRTLFYDPRTIPPFFNMDQFPLQRTALSTLNLTSALLASGSIPLVMEGVPGPAGAAPGMYRDGGLIDYHLDLPFGTRGIVLFPHFRARIIPGWLDKMLPWRKPQAANMEHVVLLCPSQAFIDRLPNGKIPDRDDFVIYRGRDEERFMAWKRVTEAGRILGDEFLELVGGSGMRTRVRPLEDILRLS